MDPSSETILIIESAIAGGSLALFYDGDQIGTYTGAGGVSRSEDLLPNIAAILEHAGVNKSALSRIVVSRGPGSFTGIRIGIATAIGLGNALNIGVDGVALFDVIFSSAISSSVQKVIAAVPVGRNDVAWQRFESGVSPPAEKSYPRSTSFESFLGEEDSFAGAEFIVHSSIRDKITERFPDSSIHDLGDNLAVHIGNAIAGGRAELSGLEPIYISNSGFRP